MTAPAPKIPGVPNRFAAAREIQRVPRTDPPVLDLDPPTPASTAPDIVVQGHGWKVTAPIAILVGAASVFFGRSTAPSPDAQQITAIQIETRADIAEVKRDVAAIRESLAQRDDATRNRLTIIEARMAARP